MPAESFLRLLQFSDGLFPAGGYAHSFGLETLVQSGRVENAADVGAFLQTYLADSAAPTDAVATLCAAKHSHADNLGALIQLDHLLDAVKPAAETREASRQMGRQTLRVLRELFSTDHQPLVTSHSLSSHSPLATSHFFSHFSSAVESGETPCHHPIVFGIASALHGWEPRETASAFLYATSAMIVGAALRLLPLGQLAGQRILAQAGTLIATLAEAVLDKTQDDICSFTPEIEIAAMRHEVLDGRLFRS